MNKKYLLGCLSILAATATLGSCSDDNTSNEDNANAGYVWTTDGGLKACNQLLFNEQGNDDAKGTVIGNGDQEFVFTGKQTLKKGTYTLKVLLFFDGIYCSIRECLKHGRIFVFCNAT